jgi:mRNA-degrading endonuclease HigB of HigAB toxin-antitoxin module
MRLLGKQRLQALSGINFETDVWLSAWTAELTNAYWKDVGSVLDAFPRAQQLDQISCIFFVCGIKSLGIKVTFQFERSIAVINQVESK